uniref:Uncharacterized protein n=1 Tax=Rhizophora mucronata TaxID=61149 RepID=A0A2P2QH54_RHIMU
MKKKIGKGNWKHNCIKQTITCMPSSIPILQLVSQINTF